MAEACKDAGLDTNTDVKCATFTEREHKGVPWPPWELPMPRCIMAAGRFPVLLPPLRLGYALLSSGSSGVESGEGKCKLLRSGREPPVFNKPW